MTSMAYEELSTLLFVNINRPSIRMPTIKRRKIRGSGMCTNGWKSRAWWNTSWCFLSGKEYSCSSEYWKQNYQLPYALAILFSVYICTREFCTRELLYKQDLIRISVLLRSLSNYAQWQRSRHKPNAISRQMKEILSHTHTGTQGRCNKTRKFSMDKLRELCAV